MKDIYTKNFNKNIKNSKFKKACALVLAAAMVSMTAITGNVSGVFAKDPDADALCGIPEHTHNSECYETHRTLACGLEEGEIHTHSADCYETERSLICDETESEGHTHTDDCYTVTEELTCGEEESDEHEHTSDCYTERRELTCGQEESEGHTHTDACYEEHEKLVCGLEEGVPHEHTDVCYEEEKELICDIQEHQHTDECYAETAKDWKKIASDLDFNGNWAHDLVMMAESQLDYDASSVIYITDEEGNKKGYTRYGDWYSDGSGDADIVYGPWNATFVSFCLNYAGVEGVPFGSDCSEWLEDIKKQDEETADAAPGAEEDADSIVAEDSDNVETSADARLYYDAADYTPTAGDLVFFGADDTAAHVGIITDVDDDKITTIEGGNGPVAYHEYTLNGDGTVQEDKSAALQAADSENTEADTIDNSAILGYVELPANPNEDEWEIKNAEIYDNLVTITDPSGNVSVAGDLPEGVTVTAEALSKSDLKKLDIDKKQVVFAYDITLWLDGEEYEPEKPVSVRVIPKEKPETDLIVTHITTDESGEATEKKTIESTVDDDGNVTFDASSFSIYIAQSTQEVELNLTSATIKELIDADTALLKWKATKDTYSVSGTEITIQGVTYTISETTYDSLYKQVYDAMLTKAGGTVDTDTTSTDISADEESDDVSTIADTTGSSDTAGEAETINDGERITATTISTDTIWNIPAGATVSMNTNITVSSGARLVILGKGSIQKTGDYSVISKGMLCMQGSVFLDGNNKKIPLVQVQSGETYLGDDFRIGNNSAIGVDVSSSGSLYMIGGLIGTKNISFEWCNENKENIGNKNYDTTLSYINEGLNGSGYDYIKSIIPTGGNTCGVVVAGKNTSLIMAGGVIAGNTYTLSGGGIQCKDGAAVRIMDGLVFGNQCTYYETTNNKGETVKNYASGGGINNSGSTVEISGGMVIANHSMSYAGGINSGGNITLSGNSVLAYNSCEYNGAALLISQNRICTMKDSARVTHNRAIGSEGVSNSGKGGAFRVVGTLDIKGGSISYNYANGQLDSTSSGQLLGGAISAQTDKTTDGTIRVATINLDAGVIENNKANGNGGAICLESAAAGYNATFKLNGTQIKGNESKNDGGAIYLVSSNGSLIADILSGSLEGNTALQNGGGIYLNLTKSGSELKVNIGENDKNDLNITDNKASGSGGGLYVARDNNTTGTINVNLYGGTLKDNSATNGGGLSVVTGSLNISGGSFESNDAQNGGGAYVSDGNVRMFGGSFKNNNATGEGGAMYVSSSSTNTANVVVRSGEISGNTSGGNGGGVAVESDSTSADKVTIGVLEEHKNLTITENGDKNNKVRSFDAFDYYDDADNGTSHNHAACPVIKNNTADGNGGGIYMNSGQAEMDIYCLDEDNNKSKANSSGNSIMTEGGTVKIGDSSYSSDSSNTPAKGNVSIGSSMLVSGGTVEISGTMDNPYFDESILVNIKDNTGNFTDNRKSSSKGDDGNTVIQDYKVHYFENFEGSGAYTAKQYDASATIKAEGALFNHTGYKITGWGIKGENDTTITKKYNIGDTIGSEDDHTAWGSYPEAALVLYAVWEPITYTIEFDANTSSIGDSSSVKVTGTMENQTFKYKQALDLTKNAYKITGYIFKGWNTSADGTGTSYADEYSGSDICDIDGKTITLYAQWEKCAIDSSDSSGATTGDPLSYTVSGNTITEKCTCGGHVVSVTASVSDSYYYDGKSHEVILTYSPSDKTFKASVSVKYYKKSDSNDSSGVNYTELSGDAKPTEVGDYKATVTVTPVDSSNETYEVSVFYTIKSPGEGFTVDVGATAGQDFGEFYSTGNLTVSNDDAFTVQVSASAGASTNVDGYETAPILSFDKALPSGTSIIMQDVTENQTGYYYYNFASNSNVKSTSNTEIAITEFIAMGGSDNYSYDTALVADKIYTYRFIVDFSNVSSGSYLSSDDLTVSFTYKYNISDSTESTASDGATTSSGTNSDVGGEVKIGLNAMSAFKLSGTSDKFTITAPAQSENNRWSGKSLILTATPNGTGALPSDAELTVVSGSGSSQTTQKYKLDASGKFVVPLVWAESRDITLSLNSDTVGSKGKDYTVDVLLGVGQSGSAIQSTPAAYETSAVATFSNMKMTVPADTSPSLKITKGDRLFTQNDITTASLSVNVESKNTDNCTVRANIQRKTATGEYSGDYLSANVNNGDNTFTLGSINAGAGSYRLLITVSKNNQELLSVPYYFIVQ